MIKFGLLGAGRVVTGRYLSVFSGEVRGAKVTLVADPVRARAEHAAKTLGAKAVYSGEELIQSPDVQAVVIATESGYHYEHSMAALRAGKHVIVEKPPAMKPAEVLGCQSFAESRGLMYAVIFQNRYNPAIRALKKAYAEGRFGRLVLGTIRLRWCRFQDYYEDGWHGTWKMDGGVVNQQAIHHVDALRWICGSVDEVFAFHANILNRLEAEDTMIATLRFENGGMGAIEATTAARPKDIEASISIIGETGTAVIGGIALNKISTWEFQKAAPEDANIQACSQEVPTGYGLSHAPYMQDVIDRLSAGNTAPPISGKDTVPTVELVHALYASTETKKIVKMSDHPLSSRLGIR